MLSSAVIHGSQMVASCRQGKEVAEEAANQRPRGP